ncbi:arginine--tRNA ligase [Mycoplasmopsis pulmonis]|uniref:arginine--tRNA ligase n=1 Tax=Mycoplasmopsis pulmonis TaxID=2107 RepID=UPI001004DF7F|nr:arginine--tRNA ligase [Mycoplasmopsis pulmonis]VEU68003.1 Arginyl-tRNA synthetase [Mycoplasmopsis pulmonis]
MHNIKKSIVASIIKTLENFYQDEPIKLSSSNFSDLSSNILMIVQKKNKLSLETLQELFENKFENEYVEKFEILKPGFLNLFLNDLAFKTLVFEILEKKQNYGRLEKNGQNINIEFVSANPTGFLHIGHVRNACYGQILANTLDFSGYNVTKEYYINDAGSQIETLAYSVYFRAREYLNFETQAPQEMYRGNDIIYGAKALIEKFGSGIFEKDFEEIKEFLKEESTNIFLKKIKEDLALIRVSFDIFFSEKSLYKENKIEPILKALGNYTYEKEGALWLKTSDFGDDKDRVLRKSDGSLTYFSPDIAYHNIKHVRNNSSLINIWGADHSGYIKRLSIAYEMISGQKVKVETIQLVKLTKNNQELKMSKRMGTSFTLIELYEMVGKDAIRFYMNSRSNNSNLVFDIDAILKNDSENYIYTIKYTYARAFQLLLKAQESSNDLSKETNNNYQNEFVKNLIKKMVEFPLLILQISQSFKTHLLNQYLIDLVTTFNSFYSNVSIIGSSQQEALIEVVKAFRILMSTIFDIIGIDKIEKM